MEARIITEKLDSIIEHSTERSRILTGFYLTQDDLDTLSPVLTSDIPNIGAIGRYRSIAVFDLSALKTRAQGSSVACSSDGLTYCFVQLEIIN